jgi:hypothetical protein
MRRIGSATATRRARARARLRAWIGVVALLFYSALPLVHHARAADVQAGGPRTGVVAYELCTPDGLRVVQLPPAETDRKGDPSHRPYSCPICQTLQHAHAALPPPLAVPAPVLSSVGVLQTPSAAAPHRHVVTVAQPRAPPAIA